MTQNARVARWVPTADPAEVGDSVVTTNPPTADKSLTTKFQLGGSGGGGGGLPEAPSDDRAYARCNTAWVHSINADNAGVETILGGLEIKGSGLWVDGNSSFTGAAIFHNSMTCDLTVASRWMTVSDPPTLATHVIPKSYVDNALALLDAGTF